MARKHIVVPLSFPANSPTAPIPSHWRRYSQKEIRELEARGAVRQANAARYLWYWITAPLRTEPPIVSSPSYVGSQYVGRGNGEGRRRREALLATIDGYHSESQWMARVAFFGWRCRYCGVELNQRSLTKDHQIAVASNGTDWASNLVPACQPCNSWKRDRRIRIVS